MNLYTYLVDLYNNFLAIFPVQLQWIVTLLVIIGLVMAFINLIRFNGIFLIVLIVLLPAIFPILQHFFSDVYNFFLYLLQLLKLTAPKPV